jgi:2-polyprenyl-3-methyl-5-hydroxy-6-metoxy-1,4-benzoquinol methylase
MSFTLRDVIEHLLNPDLAICGVLRVLKRGGFLVLSAPNLAKWLNRLLLFLGLQPRYSEVSTVKQLCKKANERRRLGRVVFKSRPVTIMRA